jgi:RNA polymerase sigma factor (sigma-70 family)
MSASGPVSDGPDEQEPLEELFGTVFDLAKTVASRISSADVEVRLRRTLREASRRSGETSAEQAARVPRAGEPGGRVTQGNWSMRGDPPAVALVARAADGDRDAWNEIIERYAPLVWSIGTRYQLKNQDIEDVAQTVWLLLVQQLGKLREPTALPGWVATTTQRECLRVVTAGRRTEGATTLDDAISLVDDAVIEQEILAADRNAALRHALRELPPRCQQLLAMLLSDPPRSYAEISAALQIPIGTIGPQRARCLERLRRSRALAGLGADEMRVSHPGGESRA